MNGDSPHMRFSIPRFGHRWIISIHVVSKFQGEIMKKWLSIAVAKFRGEYYLFNVTRSLHTIQSFALLSLPIFHFIHRSNLCPTDIYVIPNTTNITRIDHILSHRHVSSWCAGALLRSLLELNKLVLLLKLPDTGPYP